MHYLIEFHSIHIIIIGGLTNDAVPLSVSKRLADIPLIDKRVLLRVFIIGQAVEYSKTSCTHLPKPFYEDGSKPFVVIVPCAPRFGDLTVFVCVAMRSEGRLEVGIHI